MRACRKRLPVNGHSLRSRPIVHSTLRQRTAESVTASRVCAYLLSKKINRSGGLGDGAAINDSVAAFRKELRNPRSTNIKTGWARIYIVRSCGPWFSCSEILTIISFA